MKFTQVKLKKRQQGGFTLIEMAMVLVIIGLILGAISIGKDLQRNAEYAKIKQKFIDQWAQAYNQYYYKTGVVLADSQIAPTLAVNALSIGEADTTFHAHGIQNYNTATFPNRLCNDDGPVSLIQESSINGAGGNARTQSGDLHAYFDVEGIEMPPGRAEGREDRYVYLDTNGNPMEIQICFQWNRPDTPSNAGNVMVIKGLTPDLARMLDQMIDGKADAREGLFREQDILNTGQLTTATFVGDDVTTLGIGNAATAPGDPGREWGAVNRQEFTSATDQNFDEDQVATITAHYKMNQ